MKNETATQLQRKTTKNPKLSLRLLTAKENADKIGGIQRPDYVPLPFFDSGRRLYMGQVDMPSEPRRLYCNFLLTSTRTEFVYPTWEGVIEFKCTMKVVGTATYKVI